MQSYVVMEDDKTLCVVSGASFVPKVNDVILFGDVKYIVMSITHALPELNPSGMTLVAVATDPVVQVRHWGKDPYPPRYSLESKE